jgi:FkbM family methyltransferase
VSLLVNTAAARAARLAHRLRLGGLNRQGKGLLRAATGDTLSITVDGLRVEGSVDSWTLLNQLQAGTFESFERELFVSQLRPGMTVLDIGANIGYYTLLASRAVGPDGCVYAFEPDPRSCRSLRKNLAANDARNVHVVDKAASDASGSRTLFMSDTATHSGLHRSMGDSSPRTVEVEAVTIDELEIPTVDVIKMDIEGEEPGALLGMVETLQRSPGACVFLEFSPQALRAAGRDADAFAGVLRSRFEDTVVVDERTRSLVPFEVPVRAGRLNLKCVAPVAVIPPPTVLE